MIPENTQPHALLDGEGRDAVIVALDPAARSSGIELGLSMSLALARCPGLVFLARDATAESEAAALLRAAAWSLSPHVEDTAAGLVTAQLADLPQERRCPLAQAAIRRLETAALSARVGIAPTPLLAALAARHACPLLHVECGEPFLSPLPLSNLSPSETLAGTLALWGVHTIGELRKLPLSEVTRRLGRSGADLWEDAGGGRIRPLRLVHPPIVHEASFDCEHPLETLEPLLFIVRRLLDRLIAELCARHLAAATARLALRLEDGSHLDCELSLPEPTGNPETLFRVLLSHLQTLRTSVPIVALRLHLTPARPPVLQHGLFDATLRDPQAFNETVARASAIVGEKRVGAPSPPDTHRPDSSILCPPAQAIPPPEPVPGPPILGLPLRRFRPPHPARITTMDTNPVYVSSQPVRGSIRACRGPWRSSGNWWSREAAWRREEWDVEIDGSGLYRLLRIGEDWFVEGAYD